MKAERELYAAMDKAERESFAGICDGEWVAACYGRETRYGAGNAGRDKALRQVRAWRIDRALSLLGVEDDADVDGIDPSKGYWRDTVRDIVRHLGMEVTA